MSSAIPSNEDVALPPPQTTEGLPRASSIQELIFEMPERYGSVEFISHHAESPRSRIDSGSGLRRIPGDECVGACPRSLTSLKSIGVATTSGSRPNDDGPVGTSSAWGGQRL